MGGAGGVWGGSLPLCRAQPGIAARGPGSACVHRLERPWASRPALLPQTSLRRTSTRGGFSSRRAAAWGARGTPGAWQRRRPQEVTAQGSGGAGRPVHHNSTHMAARIPPLRERQARWRAHLVAVVAERQHEAATLSGAAVGAAGAVGGGSRRRAATAGTAAATHDAPLRGTGARRAVCRCCRSGAAGPVGDHTLRLAALAAVPAVAAGLSRRRLGRPLPAAARLSLLGLLPARGAAGGSAGLPCTRSGAPGRAAPRARWRACLLGCFAFSLAWRSSSLRLS